MQTILSYLGIQQAFHTPYHTERSGKVESLNGVIKNRLAKICAESRKPWPECLPIALYSVRTTPQRKTNLSPYEILFGSVPKTGLYFPQHMQAQFSDLKGYVAALNKQLRLMKECFLPFQIQTQIQELIL